MTSPNFPAEDGIAPGTPAEKRYEAALAWVEAERSASAAHESAYVSAVIDVSKGAIERTRDSAKQLQSAAAAVGVIYAAAVGAVYAAGENPLPIRGVIAVWFLGWAFAFSTIYLAYVTKPKGGTSAPNFNPADPHKTAVNVAQGFVRWSNEAAQQRRYWLRAASLLMACSILFLPAPFISTQAPPDPKTTDEASANVNWPPVPASDSGVDRILYKAQVEEAVASRAKSSSGGPLQEYNVAWFIAAAILFLVALIVPGVWRKYESEPQHDDDVPPPAYSPDSNPAPPSTEIIDKPMIDERNP